VRRAGPLRRGRSPGRSPFDHPTAHASGFSSTPTGAGSSSRSRRERARSHRRGRRLDSRSSLGRGRTRSSSETALPMTRAPRNAPLFSERPAMRAVPLSGGACSDFTKSSGPDVPQGDVKRRNSTPRPSHNSRRRRVDCRRAPELLLERRRCCLPEGVRICGPRLIPCGPALGISESAIVHSYFVRWQVESTESAHVLTGPPPCALSSERLSLGGGPAPPRKVSPRFAWTWVQVTSGPMGRIIGPLTHRNHDAETLPYARRPVAPRAGSERGKPRGYLGRVDEDRRVREVLIETAVQPLGRQRRVLGRPGTRARGQPGVKPCGASRSRR
jgi:hypothetical protein